MQEKLERAKELVNSAPDEALRILNEVMDEDYEGTYGQMALFMFGYLMMEAEHNGVASHIFNRCKELNPNIGSTYLNLGMAYETKRPKEARAAFIRAARLEPNNAKIPANQALLELQSGNPKKCIELCDKAIALDPTLSAPYHNKGLALLMLREWKEGWQLYHDTMGVKHRERRDYGFPEWQGEKGKTILVYGEQGVGDEIMFASCLPDLLKDNKVILDCDSRLEGLFRRSFPECTVYGTRFRKETPILDNHNDIDYQVAIGQLPHYFRNSESDFNGKPYLTVDPERAIQWKALFDTFKGRKIGITWSGGIKSTLEHKRSFSLSDFEPLFNNEDTFISLEYKQPDDDELAKYGVKSYIRATGKGGDIDDLAALVSQLDLVVTACTTVVYVAGALGIPCIVLVPSEPGYRYHIEGDFPWFESVKLVRQGKNESWKKVVENAKNTHRL